MQGTTPLFSLFQPFPNIQVLLSEKKHGGMKIRYELEKDRETLQNRKMFFTQHAISETSIVIAQLAQANAVAIVSQKDQGKYIPQTDGLLTNQKCVFLSVTVADCLPIYIYDPKENIIGLLHAGWKGLDKNIIKIAINLLKKTYRISSENLLIGIGPGIDTCHFTVQRDILEKFSDYTTAIERRNSKYFLNLKYIAQQQLMKEHILEEHIEISPVCTYCEKNTYFSYRRDKHPILQAMVASIGMR
ncbi:MAG TPA: peptidoglycan editing factor PgeF [Candidatus Saccharimonadales bacterium]|nr:peptidoglycan editing factor PgeF [Candidatus Saccharimonadales bacterium]